MSDTKFFALIGIVYIAPKTNEAVAIIAAVCFLILSIVSWFTDK